MHNISSSYCVRMIINDFSFFILLYLRCTDYLKHDYLAKKRRKKKTILCMISTTLFKKDNVQ